MFKLIMSVGIAFGVILGTAESSDLEQPANAPSSAYTPAEVQTPPDDQVTAAQQATTFYVSKAGNNADGASWDTAWNELDQIDWTVIKPGDTILLDGGPDEMTYESELLIDQSGLPDQPLTIRASDEPGHDGTVVLFGGRSQPLPYCFQQDYSESPDDLLERGIRTFGNSYIIIDGLRWSGIVIHGYSRNGIWIGSEATHITVRNVEIYNNGVPQHDERGWLSDSPGVLLGGADVTLQRVIIHDNGADAIQSLWNDNQIANFHLDQSWLYNSRPHPTEIGYSANYCTHTDGIQIYDGGVITGITITKSIIGPGFTQGVILGQTVTPNGDWADVQDVMIEDVLFVRATDNGVLGYSDTDTHDWVFNRVTVDCYTTEKHCIRIDNADHAITDSIFVGGKISFFDGLDTYSGNCQWETTGFDLGEVVDPGFANVSKTDPFWLGNYVVRANSGCQGSNITSVDQLLGS